MLLKSHIIVISSVAESRIMKTNREQARRLLLSFFAVLMPLLVNAQVEHVEIDGIWYNLTSETKEAEVTYEYGNLIYGYHSDYSGSIAIPSIVTYLDVEYRVTSIGYRAFINCSDLTDITIPERVTNIGESAFHSCNSLTTITIPENSQLTSIGNSAFSNCSSLTDISIPEGVTSIGENAFARCSSLTTVTIPKNSQLTSIGVQAFHSCSSLTTINIPEGVTKIETSAFAICESLTAITLPKGVTSIGNSAFSSCSSLTAITIPTSVTSIGAWAFSSSGLIAVTIPESVTEIASHTFRHCQKLESVVLLSKSLKNISETAFANCPELNDVYCYSETVPTTYDNQVFESSYPEKATLHVPAIALEAYKATAPWRYFGTIVAIEGEQPAEEWSEWTTLGTAVTASGKDAIMANLRHWGESTIEEWEEPITIDQRTNKADPSKQQLRLNGIFNAKDIILGYDSSTATITAEQQSTGYATNTAMIEEQGVPDPYKEFLFSINSGSYRPATGVIDLSNAFFYISDMYGLKMGFTLQIEGVTPPTFTAAWDRRYVGREGGEATLTVSFEAPIVKYRKLVLTPGESMSASAVKALYAANPETDLMYEETDWPTTTITCSEMGTYRVVLIPIGADGTAVLDYGIISLNSYAEPDYGTYEWDYLGESTVTEHVGSVLIPNVEMWEEVDGTWVNKYPWQSTITGVQTYRRADNPNIIGLRNLYGESHPYSSMFTYIDQAQDWWVYIDTTDPKDVKLLTTPVGVSSSQMGYGCFINQYANSEAATYADGVITFPNGSVLLGDVMSQDFEAAFDFRVILPTGSTVTGIPQSNGQATIYDLTGRKVQDTESLGNGIYIVNGRKVVR